MTQKYPRAHVVKSWPQFFRPITAGVRTHELRNDDRGYQVGDLLLLLEYDPVACEYTGESAKAEITSITNHDEAPCALSDQGLSEGFCILSIRVVGNSS